MPKPVFDAELPAPLSLTLDQAREVAGGVTVSSAAVFSAVPRWWWYGQPVAPWVAIPNVGSIVTAP